MTVANTIKQIENRLCDATAILGTLDMLMDDDKLAELRVTIRIANREVLQALYEVGSLTTTVHKPEERTA